MTDPIRDIHLGPPADCARPRLFPSLREGSTLDPRTFPTPEKCPSLTPPQEILFLAGEEPGLAETLARLALAAGHHPTLILPRERPLPQGVACLVADRDQGDFPRLVHPLLRRDDHTPRFSLTVDCAGTCPRHARQDLEVLALPGTHLAFLSQDLVYLPQERDFPTRQQETPCCDDKTPRWGMLREAELQFLQSPACPDGPHWTILRLSLLLGLEGALDDFPPFHRREKALREGEPIPLPSGGHWLVQPLAVADLSRILLSLPLAHEARNVVLDCAGPQRLEFRQLCQMAARLWGQEARFQEIPLEEALAGQPECAPYLCHRLYPLPWPYAGLPAPRLTPLEALKELP